MREIVRGEVLKTRNSKSVIRKSGFKPGTEGGDAGPTPILSLNGSLTVGSQCSLELQNLIDAFHANPTTTTRAALTTYIETQLGQNLQSAYPDEWNAALSGQGDQRIQVQLGDDLLEITLERYLSGTSSGGGTYDIPIPGQFSFDIQSKDIHASDSTLAYTTGVVGDPATGNLINATDPFRSVNIHMGWGQRAFRLNARFGIGGLIINEGNFLQWDKGPRRTLEIDPPTLHVPNAPTSANPVRINFDGWTGTNPQHANYILFWDDLHGIGQAELRSFVGPPIYFGFLKRDDSSLGAHPLDNWWLNTSTLTPDFLDKLVSYSSHGVSGYARASQDPDLGPFSDVAAIDAEFADFKNYIYTNPTTGRNFASAYDSWVGPPIQQNVTSTPGWVCFWWAYQHPDYAWRTPNVASQNQEIGLNHVATDIENHPWNQNFFRRTINSLRSYMAMSGDASYQGIIDPREDPLAEYTGVQDTPPSHNEPFVIRRGEWVRAAPGEEPTYSVRLKDAECLTPRSNPQWPA